jgi:hypothetical protein
MGAFSEAVGLQRSNCLDVKACFENPTVQVKMLSKIWPAVLNP